MFTSHTAIIKNLLNDEILEYIEIRIQHDFFIDARHQNMIMDCMERYAEEGIMFQDLQADIYSECRISDLSPERKPNLIIQSEVTAAGGRRYINFYLGRSFLKSHKMR